MNFGNLLTSQLPGPGMPVSGRPSTLPGGNAAYPGASWVPGTVGTLPTTLKSGGTTSNESVVQAYTAMPWENGQHLRIMDKTLAFIQRTDANGSLMDNIMTLAQMNNMLFKSHRMYLDNINFQGSKLANMTKVPEAIIDNFLRYRKRNPALYKLMLDNVKPQGVDMSELLNEISDKWKRYVTIGGILTNWNFLGGVNNLNRAVTPHVFAEEQAAASGNTLNINIVSALRAFLGNFWGDNTKMRVGTKLYLILKRAEGRGPFQILPWCSTERTFPPEYELYYEDLAGNPARGHYWYVGTVTAIDMMEPHEGARQKAIGAGGVQEPVAADAAGALPNLTVQIRM